MSTNNAATDDEPTTTIIPRPDAHACGVRGCGRDDDLARVFHPDRGARVLCPRHRKHYLGVTT